MAAVTPSSCSVFITEPFKPLYNRIRALNSQSPSTSSRFSCRKSGYGAVSRGIRARDFHFSRLGHLNCSFNDSNAAGSVDDDDEQGPPQEAVLKAISEVSKTEGRVGQTTNVVIGGTVTDDSTSEWLALDQKVNSYPTVRGFTAIGTGGDDFVQAMVVAVESVIQQPIPEGQVKQKVSSRGKYVSVNIGPVQVVSSEQVQAVYNAMRRDDRMKTSLDMESCLQGAQAGVQHLSNIPLVQDIMEGKLEELRVSVPNNPPINNGRPTSMVIKKTHKLIPAHLIAEAISTIRGLDLRWSGPITPTEMEYVRQYVFAKYPQYFNGIVEDGESYDLGNLSINVESSESPPDEKRNSPQNPKGSSPSFTRSLSDLDKTQLEASRLLDIVSKKTSFEGNFISIPEIQARNRALKHCGLSEENYLVIFMPNYKDAMLMIAESYPFFKGNYYMTILSEEVDTIREFATRKEAKVVPMPETWLDLRIKGSQLSQNFRRKCKYTPKGLFAYPVFVNETRYSMHWISEAHRNSWHVLLDATGLVFGQERLALALHRPDFVLCTLDNMQGQPLKITCLLVRKSSFGTSC